MKSSLNVEPTPVEPETGVKDPRKVADKLAELLAGTYDLVTRTHWVHWNVEGPMFFGVHMLTEGQYTELFDAADVLAERIRSLGVIAPMPSATLVGLDGNRDEKAAKTRATAGEMVEALKGRHETMARLCHDIIKVAETADDPVTADLATARATAHEKSAWMLRALAAS